MKVTLLDTETGRTLEHEDSFNESWWAEGDGSCDCNRAIAMGVTGALSECQSKRFLVVDCEPKSALTDINEDYPPELRQKHGVP